MIPQAKTKKVKVLFPEATIGFLLPERVVALAHMFYPLNPVGHSAHGRKNFQIHGDKASSPRFSINRMHHTSTNCP